MGTRIAMASRLHERVCAALALAVFVSSPAAFGQVLPRVGPRHSPGMMRKTESAESKSRTIPVALPGFPGTAQIYHFGATGFFLDYAAWITLSSEQQADLNAIKERSIGDLTAAQLRIDQAEQALWALTGSDRPDAKMIERKVREIEEMKADQRIAFIRDVGEAARILNDDQRAALVAMTAMDAGQMIAPQGSGSMEPKKEDAGVETDGSGGTKDAKNPEASNPGNRMGEM